jgi:hypothetical protein
MRRELLAASSNRSPVDYINLWIACPQGKFAGIFSWMPCDQAIHLQFMPLSQ